MPQGEIAALLNAGFRFLLATHKDPDGDGLGSMLALGNALREAKKEVVLFTPDRVPSPYCLLKGAGKIVHRVPEGRGFDAYIALDCAQRDRLGEPAEGSVGWRPVVNIDHHETNEYFGDLNYVDPQCSSTGELVYRIIQTARLPLGRDAAENIFAAIQTDTGSFRYDNTSASCLRAAAEMLERGVSPWKVSRKTMDGYGPRRLKLLEAALGTVEFHAGGKIGVMAVSSAMLKKTRAGQADTERFVDFPRAVKGVRIAVLIRQTGEGAFKFSLRANDETNVARLAARFGGGGHARAAGFEVTGELAHLKGSFLRAAARFLDASRH